MPPSSSNRSTLDLVKGITELSNRAQVKALFEQFGEVSACWLPPRGRREGPNKEYGYVKFRRPCDAEKALQACKDDKVVLWDLCVRALWREGTTEGGDSRDFNAKGSNLMTAREMYLESLRTGKGKRRNGRSWREASPELPEYEYYSYSYTPEPERMTPAERARESKRGAAPRQSLSRSRSQRGGHRGGGGRGGREGGRRRAAADRGDQSLSRGRGGRRERGRLRRGERGYAIPPPEELDGGDRDRRGRGGGERLALTDGRPASRDREAPPPRQRRAARNALAICDGPPAAEAEAAESPARKSRSPRPEDTRSEVRRDAAEGMKGKRVKLEPRDEPEGREPPPRERRDEREAGEGRGARDARQVREGREARNGGRRDVREDPEDGSREDVQEDRREARRGREGREGAVLKAPTNARSKIAAKPKFDERRARQDYANPNLTMLE
eukprot:TRINITY_DN30205_c0_g1_i1.p1 TRINITY_DN30205_c0_g1~~TRINITY_DN30205_c0_g1_i1.p1  ORF type:complete len:443 (-),score=82.07 TRINITY_DN30205_c0_g1_i1:176-1504(-)